MDTGRIHEETAEFVGEKAQRQLSVHGHSPLGSQNACRLDLGLILVDTLSRRERRGVVRLALFLGGPSTHRAKKPWIRQGRRTDLPFCELLFCSWLCHCCRREVSTGTHICAEREGHSVGNWQTASVERHGTPGSQARCQEKRGTGEVWQLCRSLSPVAQSSHR